MNFDEKKEKLENIQKEIFENVNHWLDVAEAKNFALLAFNIAVIAVILQITDMNLYLYGIVSIFIISTIIVILTSIPKINNIFWKSKGTDSVRDNLLFYFDIADYYSQDYLEQLYIRYIDNQNNISIVQLGNLNLHYAQEIVENSKITCKKYIGFKRAAILDIIGFILCIILIFHMVIIK